MAARRALRAVFAAALALGMFPAVRAQAAAQATTASGHAMAGRVAPEFAREDLAGRRVDLKAYRGKVVLLNFWATWCGPCRLELPRFAAWQRKLRPKGLQVIAVSMDDSAAPVRQFVRTLKPGFPVVMGDADLGRAYGGVLGLPVTFLIGRDGRIVSRTDGGADLPAMERQVKKLLVKQ